MKTASRHTKVVIVVVMTGLLFTTDAFATSYRADTHISIAAPRHVQSGHRFTISGFLRSTKHYCRASSKIKLIRVGSGVVGTKRTTKRGHYSFQQTIGRTSRYYTKFDGKMKGVHPNIRRCNKSKSRTRTVHVR